MAYDVLSGGRVEAPAQSGRVRSATGRYRAARAPGPAIALLDPTGVRRVIAVAAAEGDTYPYESVAFSADESRMFVAEGARVGVHDPADGRVLGAIDHDEFTVRSLRVSPGGQHLAIAGESPGKLEVIVQRVGDHQVVTRHAIGAGWYGLQEYDLAWSPDGRWLATNLKAVKHRNWETCGGRTHVFRVGLPTEPTIGSVTSHAEPG